jgi:Ran GTPase-activating protein (RanGAP) involved in mRNA processing and transport
MSLDSSCDNISPAGVKLITEALRMSVTGALTSVDLRGNRLGDEGWGAIFAAICGNKDSKIMSLDAASENISPAGVKLITEALRTSVTGALTLTNLLGNQLDAKSAKMLAEVAKQKGISLCGIRRDQTTAVFFGKGLQPPDAILLASDLSQAVVTGGLTKMSLANNKLGEEGTKAICEALEQNKTLKELDISGSFYGGSNIGGSAGVKHVAKMLGVNGGLTALNLSSNRLDDEGVSAVCEAIQNNKETKLASLNFENNGISPVGANAVTAMVAVTGGLTSLDLSSNQLCGLDYHDRGTYTAVGITAIADALRVNGGLTKLSLARNHLEEEGTKAICEALEQNTTLKELDIRGSNIGGSAGAKHVAKMVGINGALTEVR